MQNRGIILQINSDLGKTACMGDVAEKVARYVHSRGALEHVICRNKRHSSLPKSKTKIVAPFYDQFSLVLNALVKVGGIKINAYNIKNNIFDNLSLRFINSPGIFHTWDRCARSLKKAKEKGATTILDVAMDIWPGSDLAFVDYVFAPSLYLCEKAKQLGFDDAKVFYHPFGVDINHFTPGKKRTDKIQFMFSGILNDRKGIKELLEAWVKADLTDAVLVLCGRQTPFFKNLYQKLRPNNVELRGFLSWDELKREYQRSHVFVFPSKKEGSAKAIYEALACGLVVITTNESGSVITDGREGFIVNQSDSDELAEKIQLIASDNELRKKIACLARITAEANSWHHYQERTMAFYAEIAKQQAVR